MTDDLARRRGMSAEPENLETGSIEGGQAPGELTKHRRQRARKK
jgi:hypothetical protein